MEALEEVEVALEAAVEVEECSRKNLKSLRSTTSTRTRSLKQPDYSKLSAMVVMKLRAMLLPSKLSLLPKEAIKLTLTKGNSSNNTLLIPSNLIASKSQMAVNDPRKLIHE